MRGRYPNRGYPKIFDDKTVGSEAKKLFADAQKMMEEIIENGSFTLKGVVGLFPANLSEDGEDVDIFDNEADREAGKIAAKFCMLRQQAEKESDDPFLSHHVQPTILEENFVPSSHISRLLIISTHGIG